MGKFVDLPSPIRFLIFLTAFFLLYGYGSRMMGLYLFWEARWLGWMLTILVFLSLLWVRIGHKTKAAKTTISEKILGGIFIFCILLNSGWLLWIPSTACYKVAATWLHSDSSLRTEIGPVQSLSLVPGGKLVKQISLEGSVAESTLRFIVKGEKKYKDVRVDLVKKSSTNWKVISWY